MTAVPQRAAAMATAGVLPQATLTTTRNTVSAPVMVSDRNHGALNAAECCHSGLFFLTVVVIPLLGQTPPHKVEMPTETPATSPSCSWVRRTTPAPARDEGMARCGAPPPTTTTMTRSGASVLTRVSNIKTRRIK